MATETLHSDHDYSSMRLIEVVHVIASETEQDRLVESALRSLSHLGHSKHVELISIDDDSDSAKLLGLLQDGEIREPVEDNPISEQFRGEIMVDKYMKTYMTPTGSKRLCVPMIGSKDRVIGMILIEPGSGSELTEADKEKISMLSLMIGVTLERIWYIHISMFDELTGLYNRRQFDIRLREELARINRYAGSIGLVMADIDNFKRFNDTYGHQQGDIVLQEMAVILKDAVRKNVDITCRFGGEELMIIMPNTDIDGAYAAAERFRKSCDEHAFSGQDEPLTVTVSCGVAAIDSDSEITRREFLRRVDTMLYKAKEDGRNRVDAWR